MLHDTALAAPMRPARRVRATGAERLLRAIATLAGPQATVLHHHETAWASITFAGSRHTIALAFKGWEACDDADHLIAELPEHEFAIPGALVADATVTRVDHSLLPEPRMEVEIELLLLDER